MAGSNHPEGVDPPIPLAPTLADLSGTTLEGRYELGRVLGTGGMGAVFEAKHLLLGRLVAIKVLRPIFVDHDEYIERFLREARAASMIRHRNVVEILDFGRTSNGLVYSVMELLRGQDLHKLLKSQAGSRLPWGYACGLLVQIANGLKAAHARGVIHRDIKPANCFVTEDEEGEPLVKVVDFGVAKLDDVDQAQQLTSTAQLLGTPNYIAPELVRTKSAPSPRSDIYSLGVLAYRVLTGHVPFSGDTIFEVLRLSCFEPVPSLCDQVPGLPLAVEALVIKMLAKDPDERPQDMLAVREALLALGRNTLGANALDIPASSAIQLDLSDLVSELASDLHRDAPAKSALTTMPRRADRSDSPSDEIEALADANDATRATERGATPREPADAIPQPLAARVRTDAATMAVQLDRAVVPVAAAVSVQVVDPATASPTVVEAPAATEPAIAVSPVQDPSELLTIALSARTNPPASTGPFVPAPVTMAAPFSSPSTATPGRTATIQSIPEIVVAAPEPDPLHQPRGSSRRLAWLASASVLGAVGAVIFAVWANATKPDIAEDRAPVSPVAPAPAAHTAAQPPAPQPPAPQPPAPNPEPEAIPVAVPIDEAVVPPSSTPSDAPPGPTVKPTSALQPGGGPKLGPSDGSLKKKLAKKIAGECAAVMKGGSIEVTIIVADDGEAALIKTNPNDAAGRCAAAQVKDTKFRKRPAETKVVFTVK